MDEIATSSPESKLPPSLAGLKAEIVEVTDYRGDLTVVVRPESIRAVIRALKQDSATPFNVMMDLFGMDYLKYSLETPERFAVVYNLYSMGHGARIFVKAFLPEAKPEIDSIYDIYKAANWFEREAFDLFGVIFRNHPNLIRILCHNEFVGHPLRKDYPSDQYQRLRTAAPSSEI